MEAPFAELAVTERDDWPKASQAKPGEALLTSEGESPSVLTSREAACGTDIIRSSE